MDNARHVRRQGVIYGPVQPMLRGDEGSPLQQVLGVGVVVLALGVLFFGVTPFIAGAPGPSHTPPPASLSVAPSPSSTPHPSPTATPRPTPTPTPSPTPFALAIHEGPGFVTFGTSYDASLRVTDPGTTFVANKKMVWSADVGDDVDSHDLTVRVSTYDPDTGTEQMVLEEAAQPVSTSAHVFVRGINPRRALAGAAIYVVRYYRGTEILAEGWFEATPGS